LLEPPQRQWLTPLLSSDAWNNVTFIAGEIKESKEYS
jgi:hypothetical protein